MGHEVSLRTSSKSEPVLRCVPRQDGGYLIVTRKASGSSPVPLPEGAAVLVRDGRSACVAMIRSVAKLEGEITAGAPSPC